MPYTNSLSGSAYADVLTLPTVGLIIVTLLDEGFAKQAEDEVKAERAEARLAGYTALGADT